MRKDTTPSKGNGMKKFMVELMKAERVGGMKNEKKEKTEWDEEVYEWSDKEVTERMEKSRVTKLSYLPGAFVQFLTK